MRALSELFNEYFLPLALFIGIPFLLLLGLIAGLDYLDCRGFRATGYETQWSWGCYAKVDGVWMPKDFVFGKANEIRVKVK